MGIVLLFFSEYLLPIFKIGISNESWIYLLGFVLICSSYYYLRSAISNNKEFAIYTTHTRFAAPLIVIYLILSNKADWHFLSFGIIDGLGGLWTLIELKKTLKK